MSIQKFTKITFPPVYNTMGICKQVNILIFLSQLYPRLVSQLKFKYAFIQILDAFGVNASSHVINYAP
jgi:hypothetical protein